MKMIDANALLDDFESMMGWRYVMGSAEKGCVDCSGAFVYAFRKHGASIYHGSNRIARTEIVELLPMCQAKEGMAAFKLRAPGSAYYALPSSYKPGGGHYNGDLNDYYHIGLVGRDGQILNAQSSATGFVKSKASTWHCCGYLKQVNYGQEESPMEEALYQATVTASTGSTVNLRKAAGTSAAVLERVNIGTTVDVIEEGTEWHKIRTASNTGFMMACFLTGNGSSSPSGTSDVQTLEERVKALERAVFGE